MRCRSAGARPARACAGLKRLPEAREHERAEERRGILTDKSFGEVDDEHLAFREEIGNDEPIGLANHVPDGAAAEHRAELVLHRSNPRRPGAVTELLELFPEGSQCNRIVDAGDEAPAESGVGKESGNFAERHPGHARERGERRTEDVVQPRSPVGGMEEPAQRTRDLVDDEVRAVFVSDEHIEPDGTSGIRRIEDSNIAPPLRWHTRQHVGGEIALGIHDHDAVPRLEVPHDALEKQR